MRAARGIWIVVAALTLGGLALAPSARADGATLLLDTSGATDPHAAVRDLVAVDGSVFFFELADGGPPTFWRSEGTAHATTPVVALPEGAKVSHVLPAAHTVFFMAGAGLWRSDGTAEGTQRIGDWYDPALQNWAGSNFDGSDGALYEATTIGDALFVAVFPDYPASVEWPSCILNGMLMRYDGSPGGRTMVASLRFVFAALSTPHNSVCDIYLSSRIFPTALRDRLAFFSAPGTLFGTDAAGNAPEQLAQFDGMPRRAVVVDDRVLVFAGFGESFWRTDGTDAGTFTLGGDSSYVWRMFAAGPRAFALELGGVLSVMEVAGGEPPRNLGVFSYGAITSGADVGGVLYFAVTAIPTYDGTILPDDELGLWRSDGTTPGTTKIVSLNVGSWIVDVGGRAVFAAPDPADARRQVVWQSDGTAAGTLVAADVTPVGDTRPTVVGRTLFFVGTRDGSVGLWALTLPCAPTLDAAGRATCEVAGIDQALRCSGDGALPTWAGRKLDKLRSLLAKVPSHRAAVRRTRALLRVLLRRGVRSARRHKAGPECIANIRATLTETRALTGD